MKSILLCFFIVFGSYGQRDVIVNRRARQRLTTTNQDTQLIETAVQRISRPELEPTNDRFIPYHEQGALQRARTLSIYDGLEDPNNAAPQQLSSSSRSRSSFRRRQTARRPPTATLSRRRLDSGSELTAETTSDRFVPPPPVAESRTSSGRSRSRSRSNIGRSRSSSSDRTVSSDRSSGSRSFSSEIDLSRGSSGVSRSRAAATGSSRRTVRRRTNNLRTSANSISSSESSARDPEKSQVSRSRSRLRLRTNSDTTPQRSRGRSRSRAGSTARTNQADTVSTAGRSSSRSFASSSSRGSGRSLQSRRINLQDTVRTNSKTNTKNTSERKIFRVKFPRKDLVRKVEETNYIKKETFDSSSKINRFRTDIKPTKVRPSPSRPAEDEVYSRLPEIQSSRPAQPQDTIIVTHQVPAKTIFTITEGEKTRSLFIDTFTTSLQEVSIAELKSTYIDDSPVIYAHSTTTQGFGVQETLIDAIHPTRTAVGSSTAYLGNADRKTVSTEYSTIYNVQTITVRNTPTLENLQVEPGISQIGSLLQNVILGLLGGNLLGGGSPLLAGAQNPLLFGGQPNLVPQTNLITHTRSFVTTATEIDTILVPVNFRGTKIVQTVTDTSTKVYTTTDTSIQTLVQPGLVTKQPFLPLAPTLHRATRVVDSTPAFPLANALAPTPSLKVVTLSSEIVTTVDTEITSDIVVTLGGREIETEFIHPTKQVSTLTVYSTKTVALHQPPPLQQQQNALKQLQVLNAILQLRG